MKKIFFLVLACVLLVNCSEKKTDNISLSNNATIDSLFKVANDFNINKKISDESAEKISDLLKAKENDSITRYYSFMLSSRHYNFGEYEKYLKTCRENYRMAEKSSDSLGIAKSLYYIGNYYYIKFNNDSAYYYFTKAEKTYLRINNNEYINKLRLYKANIQFYENDCTGSEIAVVNILKNLKSDEDVRLTYECYISLGNSLEGLNNNEQALIYYNKAYEIANKFKKNPEFLILMAQTYNYIGKVYQEKKEYKKAVCFFNIAIDFKDLRKNAPLIYSNLVNNLGYSKFKLGDGSAKFFFDDALKIRDSLLNTPGIVTSKINLAEYYLSKSDTINALQNINDARKKSHDNKIFEDELKTLQLLTIINPKNNDAYNNRFIKLTDSLQNNERSKRNKFARIEFETDEILNQKNNIEAEKNEISSQRWVILGFSLIIILVIVLLYITKLQHSKNKELKFEKQQQKANEEIYQLMLDQQSKIEEGRQKEKKRIAQELHDGIMSKLTSTRLNLFILTKKNDEETIKKCLVHIEGIQNIEKEIRSISHDLSKDIFTSKDSFKTIIIDLFKEQEALTNVNYNIDIDESINWETIESTIKMHLYRIFQESLQNIYKYAKAKNVFASITKHNEEIHIEINDDGLGFNVNKLKEGIGLKNIRSRVEMINGELDIKSEIEKGTHINLIIPT